MSTLSRCDNSQGAEQTASQLIYNKGNDVESISSTMIADAEAYMNQIMGLFNGTLPSFDAVGVASASKPTDQTMPSRPTPPGQQTFTLGNVSNVPSAPSADLRTLDLPPFNVSMPNITIHEAPDVTWPEDPGAPPQTEEVETPSPPSYTTPQKPGPLALNLEPAPVVDVAALQVTRPTKAFSAPGHNFVYVEPDFDDKGMVEPLRDEIIKILEGEGRMLTEAEEEALFNRGRDRLRAERERELVNLAKKEAARGFPAPTGTYWALRHQANEQFSIRLQELIRDVIVEQARLAAQNRTQGVQVAQAFVGELIRLHEGAANRAMEAAVHTWEHGFKLHEAAVADLQAQIAIVDAEAKIHEAELNDAMARLERWKATLDGAKLEAEVHEALIRIYEAEWNALKIASDMFNTEMQGARLKADLQEQALKNHGLLLQNYGERIQANIARYDATAKQNAAEMSKAEVYKIQTEAWNNQADAQIKLGGYDIEKAKLRLAEWETEKQRVDQELNVATQEVQIAMDNYKNLMALFGEEVKMYEAEARFASDMRDGDVKVYAAETDANIKEAQIKVEEAKMHFDAWVELKKGLADALSSVAQISASIASSALNSLTISAGYHYSGSDSFACSSSSSTSYSESHTYSY